MHLPGTDELKQWWLTINSMLNEQVIKLLQLVNHKVHLPSDF